MDENLFETPKSDLESKFENDRVEWQKKINELSLGLKTVMGIPDLMVTIFSERQRCVDYYHYLISLLVKLNKSYRAQYAERDDFYRTKSQIRYNSDSSRDQKIKADLGDIYQKRELLDDHTKFINQTISTIDNIIYATTNRIKIEEIARGK